MHSSGSMVRADTLHSFISRSLHHAASRLLERSCRLVTTCGQDAPENKPGQLSASMKLVDQATGEAVDLGSSSSARGGGGGRRRQELEETFRK